MESNFILWISSFPSIIIEETVDSPLNALGTLVKNPKLTICMRVFSGFSVLFRWSICLSLCHCCVCMCVLATQSCLTFCDLMDGMEPTRLLYPWDSSGKDTGLGCHSLLQGIFPTQGSNPDLPHCTPILLPSEPPVESFEIGKFKSSTFVLLFQDCVGYLESHKFTYKF